MLCLIKKNKRFCLLKNGTVLVKVKNMLKIEIQIDFIYINYHESNLYYIYFYLKINFIINFII